MTNFYHCPSVKYAFAMRIGQLRLILSKLNRFKPIHPVVRLVVAAAALASVSVSAQAPLDVRVALIIGNSAYAGNMALVNPANDAKAMADMLKRLGFTVVELRDGNKAQMSAAIAQVSNSFKGKQGVGMLYYAGHGLQLDWRNYMAPVDANLKNAADVQQQTIDLNSVVDIFKAAGNCMNIVVLDACRDNPFGGNTSSAKGMVQLDAPPSTFLAYATAPGNVAENGDVNSGNGLYTQFLLQELKRPTAKIEDNIKNSRKADDFYNFLLRFPSSGEFAESAQYQLDQLAVSNMVDNLGKGQDASLDYRGPRYKVGDVFEFQMSDVLTNVLGERSTSRVTSIEGDIVKINGGNSIQTVLGSTIKNWQGTYDPPVGGYPVELQVGKKWSGRSSSTFTDGNVYNLQFEGKIIGRETVTVPAGTFQTYVVRATVYSSGGSSFVQTFWVDPHYGAAVKFENIGRRGNQIVRSDRHELTALKADRS